MLFRDTKIEENVAIGTGSSFGSKTLITNSTVGSKCKIGNNVRIENSYIWDNVVIEDNCVLNTCIVADGVHLKPNVVLNAGCLISYNVILGPNIEVKKLSQIYYDSNEQNLCFDKSIVGAEGRGLLYVEDNDNSSEEEEDFVQEIWGESDDENEDEDKYTTSTIFSDNLSDDERNESPPVDDLKGKQWLIVFRKEVIYCFNEIVFYDEVYDSLQRGIDEKVKCENLILEINSSKYSFSSLLLRLILIVYLILSDMPTISL